MHVFMIAPRLFPYDRPTIGTYYLEHAIALKRQGVKVTLFNVDLQPIGLVWRRPLNFLFQKRVAVDDGVKIIKVNGIRLPKIGYPLWVVFCVLCVLIYTISNGKPDRIISQRALLAGSAGKILARLLNVPLFIIEHSSAVLLGKLKDRDKVRAKKAYQYAQAVSAVSKDLCKRIEDEYHIKRVDLIPNVIRPEMFPAAAPIKPFSFVSVGNLDGNKRMIDVIKAFSGVVIRYPNVKLSIIGSGPEKLALEAFIKANSLEESVQLYGAQSREFVSEILGESHCFVLASEVETFGVVIIEALAAGLPCICSDTSGARSILLYDYLGKLFKVGQVAQLEKLMSDMVRDCKKTIDNNKDDRSLFVKDNFSSSVVGKNIKSWIGGENRAL